MFPLLKLICDYCLEEGRETVINRKYYVYLELKKKAIVDKDCCDNCKIVKHQEAIQSKYGVNNIAFVPGVQEKRERTNIKLYGYPTPLQNKKVKEKIKRKNIEKYGFNTPSKNEQIKQKVKETNLRKFGAENNSQTKEHWEKVNKSSMKKFGVPYPSQSNIVKAKVIETNLRKFGVPYSSQSDIVQQKVRESFYKNGTCPTSPQQLEVYNILKDMGYNVELNYPLSRTNLDIALFDDNTKINIEYDSWYWHKDRLKKDYQRDYFLKKEGWKVFRIKSNTMIPRTEDIIYKINKLLITNETYTQIILPDWGKLAF